MTVIRILLAVIVFSTISVPAVLIDFVNVFKGRPLDVFDDLLARALRCLSHRPLLSDYDEPETLP